MAIIYIVYEKRWNEAEVSFDEFPNNIHFSLMKMVEEIKLRKTECRNFTTLLNRVIYNINDAFLENKQTYKEFEPCMEAVSRWLQSCSLSECKAIKLEEEHRIFYILGFSDKDWKSDVILQYHFLRSQDELIHMKHVKNESSDMINYQCNVKRFPKEKDWASAIEILGGYVDKMMRECESADVLDDVMALERCYALSIPYIIMFYMHAPKCNLQVMSKDDKVPIMH